MSDTIKLKKGLDLPLKGKAEKEVVMEVVPDLVALKPTDFKGLVPRLTVKEGDPVKAGSPLFCDKSDQNILFTSPVSGTVQSIVRGDKRKLLAVVVKADPKPEYVDFGTLDLKSCSASDIRDLMLRSGLWAAMIQRPYGIVPRTDAAPKAVFVSAFNTAPNAADTEYTLAGREADIQKGINAISKMAGVPVHVGIDAALGGKSIFASLKGVSLHAFQGRHPAGNVGVQIHHISPILKGETVWTVSPLFLAALGSLVSTGRLDLSRLVALTGDGAAKNAYVKTVPGMAVASIASLVKEGKQRIISGNVLCGTAVGADGYFGFFDDQISVVAEGDYKEMLGWANPVRSKLFSNSRAYFSWLCPKKRYAMDTNVHGGVRAFMFNTLYSDVLPMHIFPVYLCKACMAQDIDKMERYGIYEVLPEDLATCEFVCPSKIEWQKVIGEGIDLMLKEMA